MKLNVGCGADSWGDVRVDTLRGKWMAIGKSSANLLADAQYLPFKDKCFDELRVHEVLEHIPDWRKALFECCRVTKQMSITVPVDSYMPKHYVNWFIDLITLAHPRRFLRFLEPAYLKYAFKLRERTSDHLWQFNVHTLKVLLRKVGFKNIQLHTLYYSFLFGKIRKKFSWLIVASES